jgi:hypothetical protein
MKSLTKAVALLFFAGVCSYAETWTGKLVDAACYDSKATPSSAGDKTSKLGNVDKECAPTASTTAYAVHANGKFYKLDSSGNAKIAADLKSGAIKADKDGDVHASVTGSLDGDTVKVDTVKGGK